MRGKDVETVLRQALNLTDLEIYTIGTAIEARAWLQNMIIDIAIIRNKLETKILASPKVREKTEEIEHIIGKIFSYIDDANIEGT